MTCGFCGRFTRIEPLPPGWRIHGSLVFCRQCRRQRFRLRFISMTVAEPVGAEWQEFRVALEKTWRHATPLLLTKQAWELTTVRSQHIARIFIGDQWWVLCLHDAKWSHARREIYEKIASGQAAAGELLLYPRSAYDGRIHNRPSNDLRPYEIECKTEAWLPRDPEQLATLHGGLNGEADRPDARIRNRSIGEIDLGNLRRAIRANWISFPSQVPSFPGGGQANLQQKVVQLYFLMGWSCARIATRYGLTQERVRDVLRAWKRRAANAGYLQHIPSVEVMRQLEMLALLVPDDSGEKPPGPGDRDSTAGSAADQDAISSHDLLTSAGVNGHFSPKPRVRSSQALDLTSKGGRPLVKKSAAGRTGNRPHGRQLQQQS
jgi:hypothetical protein